MRPLILIFLFLISFGSAFAISTTDWPSKLDNGFNVSTQPISPPIIFRNASGTFQTATYYLNRTSGGSVAFWNVLNSLSGNSLRFKNPINATGLVIQGVKNLTRYTSTNCFEWYNETSELNETVCEYSKQVSFDVIPLSSVSKTTQSEYIYTFTAPWGQNHFNFTTYFDPDWDACGIINASGTYDLTGDVSVLGTTCFTVNATDVIIDCHGFSITGNNTTATYGVDIVGFNATVKNCNIQNFSNGIRVYNEAADFANFTNNTINQTFATSCSSPVGSCAGIYIRQADNAFIDDNRVNVYSTALYMYSDSYYITVQNSQFNASADYGVNFRSNVSFINNIVKTLSTSTALSITGNNYIADNNITSASGYSISVGASSNSNVIVRNNLSSGSRGISITTSDYLIIENNTIKSSSTSATNALIYLASGTDYTNISGNVMYSTAAGTSECRGIMVSTGTGTRFFNNTINISSSSGTAAIYVDAGQSGNFFFNNSIRSALWVTDLNDTNYYNSSTAGNTYYFANGTGAWEVSPNGIALTTINPPNWNTNTSAWINATTFSEFWVGNGTDFLPWTNNTAGEAPVAANYTNITSIFVVPLNPITTDNISCNVTVRNSVEPTLWVNITFYKNNVNQSTNITYNITNNTATVFGNETSLVAGDNWSCSGVAWSSVNISVLNMSANVTVASGTVIYGRVGAATYWTWTQLQAGDNTVTWDGTTPWIWHIWTVGSGNKTMNWSSDVKMWIWVPE